MLNMFSFTSFFLAQTPTEVLIEEIEPTVTSTITVTPTVTSTPTLTPTPTLVPTDTIIPTPFRFGVNLGWVPPSLGDTLTFLIRFFFVAAGLLALFQLLTGALAWITSGGEKGNVEKARDKIVAAVVGVVLIVIVLSIAVTLERIVFKCVICFGLSCPVAVPSIIEPASPQVGCPARLF